MTKPPLDAEAYNALLKRLGVERKAKHLTPARKAELEAMLKAMDGAACAFYYNATQIGHHAFIEFCGLMREYVNICRDTLAAGVDFTETTAHGGSASLKIASFRRKYLAEKLSCMFETSLPALIEGKP